MVMAIMVMDIIKQINKYRVLSPCVAILIIWGLVPSTTFAGDWQLKPYVNLDETYTDNVELTSLGSTSSYVTQTMAGLEAEYTSPLTAIQFSGTQVYA